MASMVTLIGRFAGLAGSPAAGEVVIRTDPQTVYDRVGRLILTSPVRLSLDEQGQFAVPLPATDDPDLEPSFTYEVRVATRTGYWSTTGLSLPAAAGTVNLAA